MIDETDRRILRHLRENGRISILDLAAAVGLSPTPVSRRLARLEGAGIIEGYSARIDEGRAGFPISAFLSIQLERQVDDALEAFEAAVQSFPEVVDCWLMTGNRDYLLRVATGSLQDFEAFLTGRLTKVPGVAKIESSIPLRRVKGALARTP